MAECLSCGKDAPNGAVCIICGDPLCGLCWGDNEIDGRARALCGPCAMGGALVLRKLWLMDQNHTAAIDAQLAAWRRAIRL